MSAPNFCKKYSRLSAAPVGVLIFFLSGCAIVALEPATNATNPACAEIMVRLPDVVAEQGSRETNAQATAAWGSPASVLLRCGLDPLGPSSLRCVSVSDVDWLVDDSKAPSYRFVTFGRNPATEVIVDSRIVSGATVLSDLAQSVSAVPDTKNCSS